MKIAPATITPEQAPIDWMMTFWPRGSFFFRAPLSPTAIIAIGCLEYLTDLKAEICRGCAEHYGQNQTGDDRVGRYFAVIASRVHDRPVRFVLAEFAKRVVGKGHGIGIGVYRVVP